MHDDHEARRRKVLGIGVALAAAALVEPAGAQTKKVPKADAQYQDKPKNGQECENCVQFTAPSSCKLVEGKIDPHGWCLFFVQKPR